MGGMNSGIRTSPPRQGVGVPSDHGRGTWSTYETVEKLQWTMSICHSDRAGLDNDHRAILFFPYVHDTPQ